MATRFNSAQTTLTGNGNFPVVTATTDTIISSVVLRFRSTESVELFIQKSGQPQVSFLLATANGELLDAPIALENGDILSCTVGSYVRDMYLLTSYAYESPSYAGESINVHNDVDITTPSDGQVLTYSAATGNWENADSTGGGGGGAIPSYLHTQSTNSASWVVTHDLGNSQPLVQVFDNASTIIVPENIVINSANQLTVTFSTAIQGYVRVAGGSITGGNPILNRTIITGTASVSTTAHLLGVSLSAVATLTLPDPASLTEGHQYIVKDEAGNFGTYNLTLATAAGTIDGESTQVFAIDYSSISVYTDGTNYFIT